MYRDRLVKALQDNSLQPLSSDQSQMHVVHFQGLWKTQHDSALQ